MLRCSRDTQVQHSSESSEELRQQPIISLAQLEDCTNQLQQLHGPARTTQKRDVSLQPIQPGWLRVSAPTTLQVRGTNVNVERQSCSWRATPTRLSESFSRREFHAEAVPKCPIAQRTESEAEVLSPDLCWMLKRNPDLKHGILCCRGQRTVPSGSMRATSVRKPS